MSDKVSNLVFVKKLILKIDESHILTFLPHQNNMKNHLTDI